MCPERENNSLVTMAVIFYLPSRTEVIAITWDLFPAANGLAKKVSTLAVERHLTSRKSCGVQSKLNCTPTLLPFFGNQTQSARSSTHPFLWCEIGRDIQEKLRCLRSECVDRPVRGLYDRHIRTGNAIVGV